MKMTFTVELDVTPGTLTSEVLIAADVVTQLTNAANQLGFNYGEQAYTVNSELTNVTHVTDG